MKTAVSSALLPGRHSLSTINATARLTSELIHTQAGVFCLYPLKAPQVDNYTKGFLLSSKTNSINIHTVFVLTALH